MTPPHCKATAAGEAQRSIVDANNELASLAAEHKSKSAKKDRLWKVLTNVRSQYKDSMKEVEDIEGKMETKRSTIRLLTQVALPATPSSGAFAPGFNLGTSPIQPRQVTLQGIPVPSLPTGVPKLLVATVANLEPQKKKQKQLTIEESFSASKSWEEEAVKATAAVEDAHLLMSAKKSYTGVKAKSPPESLFPASTQASNQTVAGLKTTGFTTDDYDQAMMDEAIALSKAEAESVRVNQEKERADYFATSKAELAAQKATEALLDMV